MHKGKKGLTDGAEIIISKALKRGTLNEVKKDVFSQIQSLENTFRSWMKQQEKTHLRGIEEDLLILSKGLKMFQPGPKPKTCLKQASSSSTKQRKPLFPNTKQFSTGMANKKADF